MKQKFNLFVCFFLNAKVFYFFLIFILNDKIVLAVQKVRIEGVGGVQVLFESEALFCNGSHRRRSLCTFGSVVFFSW